MILRLAVIFVFVVGCSWVHAQSVDTLLANVPSLDTLDFKQEQKLDSIRESVAGEFGSLKNSYDSVTSVADQASKKIQQRIDSLNNLQLPVVHLTQKLDSIAAWKEKKLSVVNNKVNDLKKKVADKVQSLDVPDELKDKAQELTSVVDKLDASLPTNQLPDLSLNGKVPLNTSGLNIPGGQSLPDVPGMENPIPNANLPGTPNVEMPAEVGEVTGQVNQVTEAIPKNTDDVAKTIEDQAGKVQEVGEVQKQIGEADKLKELTGGNMQDPEAMKKEAIENAKKQAVNHFAGKEEQLKAAMEQIAKYKKKYSSVQSIADLPKKRPNEMRSKPFVERLVPGLALQVHRRSDDWLLDLNPYVGYRFNPRLSAGIGWNQRIGYNVDEHAFKPDVRIYGPRIYGEYKIGKGFSGHLEAEYMNTWVPPRFSSKPNDPTGREWVFSPMAGMKKEYRIVKNVKGTVFILYNLYDPHHRSPYGDKLNMRIGFEFPLKKKKKES